MRLLILFAALYATGLTAQEIYSCEARSAVVDAENLESKSYDKVYPTIIINKDDNSLSYVYSAHGMQFKTIFQIEAQSADKLIGIYMFNENEVQIIHMDKVTKKFNRFFSGGDLGWGNTLTAGRCFN